MQGRMRLRNRSEGFWLTSPLSREGGSFVTTGFDWQAKERHGRCTSTSEGDWVWSCGAYYAIRMEDLCLFGMDAVCMQNNFSLISSLPPLSHQPDPPDYELRGPVSGPGVCPGQGAVPRTQPCHPFWLHWCHCGEAAWWVPAVLAVPRPLRQDGCPPVPRESGRGKKNRGTTSHY